MALSCLLCPQRSLPIGRERVLVAKVPQRRQQQQQQTPDASLVAATNALRRHKHSHLRFLSFGTSKAWGAGLKHRQYQAYPYLLSANVTNLAIRAAGPEFPSLCLQTLLKDDTFDVITIEFNHVGKESEALTRLATRLRRRFPLATIIFFHVWSPYEYEYRGTPIMRLSSRGGGGKGKETIASLTNGTHPSDWKAIVDRRSRAVTEEVARQVGGHVHVLPRPENALEALEIGSRLFLPHDLNHYSPAGHVYMYRQVLRVLEEQRVERTSHLVHGQRPWGEQTQDWCEKWFDHGKTALTRGGNLQMVNFVKNQKYALEVGKPHGYLEVDNTLHNNNTAKLFVNYMMAGPNKMYPSTCVTVVCNNNNHHQSATAALSPKSIQKSGTSLIIHPLLPSSSLKTVHIVGTAQLGTIPSGRCRVHFEPLEEESLPFRVVGVEIVSDAILVPTSEATIERHARARQ